VAAIFWVLNGSLIEPLGGSASTNQVMCAFFLAAGILLPAAIDRSRVGPESPARERYEVLQWITFLAGFGAQELNMVYPVWPLATHYSAPAANRRTLPMFGVSIIYVLGHNRLAPIQRTGDYGMHFTGAIWRVLWQYWTWS